LHIDPFPTYGGPRHSSLTIPELVTHLPDLENSSYEYPAGSSAAAGGSFQQDVETGSRGRQYGISLYPAILPARGKLIDTLISSGVSGYIGFRVVDGVGLLQPSTNTGTRTSTSGEEQVTSGIKKVPSSKGQVFKDKTLSLMEKRKLMKMLMFVANLDETKAVDDALLKGKYLALDRKISRHRLTR
jgi:RAB protein geranylgeranyltransferase component A